MRTKFQLKHCQSILTVLLIALMSVSLAACGDDKDEPDNDNAILGKWHGYLDNDRESYFTFKPDGTLVWAENDEKDGWEEFSNNKWSISGETLRLDLNIVNGKVDDYTSGKYTIKGKTLTYTYKWYDGDGKWEGDETYTVTFTKE